MPARSHPGLRARNLGRSGRVAGELLIMTFKSAITRWSPTPHAGPAFTRSVGACAAPPRSRGAGPAWNRDQRLHVGSRSRRSPPDRQSWTATDSGRPQWASRSFISEMRQLPHPRGAGLAAPRDDRGSHGPPSAAREAHGRPMGRAHRIPNSWPRRDPTHRQPALNLL